MSVPQGHIDMVQQDIQRIEMALKTNDPDSNWTLFRQLDGRYQACVRDWYQGMWASNRVGTALRYDILLENPGEIADNLSLIKSKLETYQYLVNAVTSSAPATQVNVTTNFNLNMSFHEVRQKIEDMTALNQEQTDEIIGKIDELEEISKENTSRKKKWEKVKPILLFALDKGADIATSIMALVLQMKLGL